MSKTTKRHGRLKYTMTLATEANPKPTERLLRQWEMLDDYSQKAFTKPYHALTSEQKTQLHFNINTGVYNAT